MSKHFEYNQEKMLELGIDIPAAKYWVKQFFEISPIADDGILKALGLVQKAEVMSRSLYKLLQSPAFWGPTFQWPHHHGRFDSKRIPIEMLDTTIGEMAKQIESLKEQTGGGVVYLIRPHDCSLPGGNTFTKFGKHALGSSRIEDLKKRGAFKIDWETCALVILPPSPKSIRISAVSQFENGVRFCTKRFLGNGCEIDGCRNEYMHQSKELLAASVIGMEAVAAVMDNQMSVRSMIAIFGNAQANAMHKEMDELPSNTVIRDIGSGHAHDTGSGMRKDHSKRKGNRLASGTVYFAKSKSLFCGRTLFKIGASGNALARMRDLYSEQHWCIAFEQIAAIEVDRVCGQQNRLHDVEKIVSKRVLQMQSVEFELQGQLLNDEYFLLNSDVERETVDIIVAAFNQTTSNKKSVATITAHFKESLSCV